MLMSSLYPVIRHHKPSTFRFLVVHVQDTFCECLARVGAPLAAIGIVGVGPGAVGLLGADVGLTGVIVFHASSFRWWGGRAASGYRLPTGPPLVPAWGSNPGACQSGCLFLIDKLAS